MWETNSGTVNHIVSAPGHVSQVISMAVTEYMQQTFFFGCCESTRSSDRQIWHLDLTVVTLLIVDLDTSGCLM